MPIHPACHYTCRCRGRQFHTASPQKTLYALALEETDPLIRESLHDEYLRDETLRDETLRNQVTRICEDCGHELTADLLSSDKEEMALDCFSFIDVYHRHLLKVAHLYSTDQQRENACTLALQRHLTLRRLPSTPSDLRAYLNFGWQKGLKGPSMIHLSHLYEAALQRQDEDEDEDEDQVPMIHIPASLVTESSDITSTAPQMRPSPLLYDFPHHE
ncbi:MAG: hypothetical protein EBY15_10135 [Gammaproteobacteria bacterium]|nr:hypothetical protein [Gammaproteobacteria bacterium]